MRYLFAMILIASAAHADDVDALKERYYENRAMCRQGEMNGKAVTKEESDKACRQLARLDSVLKGAGQCWDAGEVEWKACK